jgi:hypothetical protein
MSHLNSKRKITKEQHKESFDLHDAYRALINGYVRAHSQKNRKRGSHG